MKKISYVSENKNSIYGLGIDSHRLKSGVKLKLGGVEIKYPKGLDGHSDGDVGYHAICDAILGALALGDLGTHFPSSDLKWAGANSKIFIDEVSCSLGSEMLLVEIPERFNIVLLNLTIFTLPFSFKF